MTATSRASITDAPASRPPTASVALARAWGAEARLYPRGHLTLLFACRAPRRDLARFLAAP